ncbi:MAG: hypothetical protein KIS67_04540 [Verrucomicrobiae bacterium]|nr:hypothetical protein [Verrucomicrobiae bacterium]
MLTSRTHIQPVLLTVGFTLQQTPETVERLNREVKPADAVVAKQSTSTPEANNA